MSRILSMTVFVRWSEVKVCFRLQKITAKVKKNIFERKKIGKIAFKLRCAVKLPPQEHLTKTNNATEKGNENAQCI